MNKNGRSLKSYSTGNISIADWASPTVNSIVDQSVYPIYVPGAEALYNLAYWLIIKIPTRPRILWRVWWDIVIKSFHVRWIWAIASCPPIHGDLIPLEFVV